MCRPVCLLPSLLSLEDSPCTRNARVPVTKDKWRECLRREASCNRQGSRDLYPALSCIAVFGYWGAI